MDDSKWYKVIGVHFFFNLQSCPEYRDKAEYGTSLPIKCLFNRGLQGPGLYNFENTDTGKEFLSLAVCALSKRPDFSMILCYSKFISGF